MKKIVILLVIYFLNINFAFSQKILPVFFADTNDPSIGVGTKNNIGYMSDVVEEIASALQLPCDEIKCFSSFDCTTANLKSYFKTFSCGPKDIVIFCYFGHGGRSTKDTSIFPQMCLGSHYDNDYIPLEDVKNVIMKHNPHLCIVLGDCCNSYGSGISTKFGILNSAGPTNVNNKMTDNFKKLFVDFSGAIISSGSQKGEYSWYIKDDKGNGYGYFTYGFCSCLDQYLGETDNPSWDGLMQLTRQAVRTFTQSLVDNGRSDKVQTIAYRIEPNTENKQNIVEHPDSVKKQKRIDLTKIDDPLKGDLLEIANDYADKFDRIASVQPLLNRHFSSDAIVETVGRDNKTVVSTETADDFLSRLATVSRFNGIAIHKCDKDNSGKVKYLLVHEVYVDKPSKL
jgi:hypothetical protein